ncbi:MAG TPA: B12-binding domain-containing protein [Pyrinomonadaceae bacterium]|jgi:excisionase family DNA binding protein
MSVSDGRKNLTSRQAARLLGASEASVKRWADGGLLPSMRTVGGHRRFRPEDVAAFRRGRGERGTVRVLSRGETPGTADGGEAEPDGVAPDEDLSRLMFETLLAGHVESASRTLVGLRRRGHSVARIADAVLCPALRRVGDLWHAGELSIAEEHLATRTALTAVQTLRDALSLNVGERPAICCAVEDDFHELPVHLAALTLEGLGWGVVNLGTSTPFYALAEAVERFAPRLVCVASTVFNHPDRAAREYGEFKSAAGRAGASVVLGGAGFGVGGARHRFPADLHAATFSQLEEHAARL